MKKKILITSIVLGLGLASVTNAQPLTIKNDTNHDSTSVINKGACSSMLPGGTTRAHSTNVVSERLIRTLCGNKDCNADIYMEGNCKGPIIATVKFNVNTGLGAISKPINGYSFDRLNNFAIVIKGGPDFK